MRWDLERAVGGAVKVSSLLSVVKTRSVEKTERERWELDLCYIQV